MLLRNYDNIMTAKNLLMGMNVTLGDTSKGFTDSNLCVKDGSGNLKNIFAGYASYGGWSGMTLNPCTYFIANASSFIDLGSTGTNGVENGGRCTLVCGSSDAPATYDDYLTNTIFTDQQVSRIVASETYSTPEYNETDNSWTSTYKTTITALQDITIKEICILCRCMTTSVKSSIDCLVYREVLETPLEVTQGTNFVLTFNKKVYNNPNKPVDYVATASVE